MLNVNVLYSVKYINIYVTYTRVAKWAIFCSYIYKQFSSIKRNTLFSLYTPKNNIGFNPNSNNCVLITCTNDA